MKPNPRGRGARYAPAITKLSRMHKEILNILLNAEAALPKSEVTRRLLSQGIISFDSLLNGFDSSGRLSELLGLKLVRLKCNRTKIVDGSTMSFRYRRKPLWSITEKGIKTIKSVRNDAVNKLENSYCTCPPLMHKKELE